MDIPSISLAISADESWWGNFWTALGAIGTIGAAIYAARSAKFASEAAETANKQLALASRPMLSFDGYSNEALTGFAIRLRNVGAVPLAHTLTELEINEVDARQKYKTPDEIVIFPGAEYMVFLGNKITVGTKIKCKIEYHALGLGQRIYFISRKGEVLSGTVATIEDSAI